MQSFFLPQKLFHLFSTFSPQKTILPPQKRTTSPSFCDKHVLAKPPLYPFSLLALFFFSSLFSLFSSPLLGFCHSLLSPSMVFVAFPFGFCHSPFFSLGFCHIFLPSYMVFVTHLMGVCHFPPWYLSQSSSTNHCFSNTYTHRIYFYFLYLLKRKDSFFVLKRKGCGNNPYVQHGHVSS